MARRLVQTSVGLIALYDRWVDKKEGEWLPMFVQREIPKMALVSPETAVIVMQAKRMWPGTEVVDVIKAPRRRPKKEGSS